MTVTYTQMDIVHCDGGSNAQYMYAYIASAVVEHWKKNLGGGEGGGGEGGTHTHTHTDGGYIASGTLSN